MREYAAHHDWMITMRVKKLAPVRPKWVLSMVTANPAFSALVTSSVSQRITLLSLLVPFLRSLIRISFLFVRIALGQQEYWP